jgi:hypothetical protein
MTAPTPTPQAGCEFTYIWNFGDAISGSGATVTHLYQYAGVGSDHNFTVTLVISTGSSGIGPSLTLYETVKVTS